MINYKIQKIFIYIYLFIKFSIFKFELNLSLIIFNLIYKKNLTLSYTINQIVDSNFNINSNLISNQVSKLGFSYTLNVVLSSNFDKRFNLNSYLIFDL